MSRQRRDGDTDWTATVFGYDRDGNLARRIDDATEDLAGNLDISGGRVHTFAYDTAGWLERHQDSGGFGWADDRLVSVGWLDNGLEEVRTVSQRTGPCGAQDWAEHQATTWTYTPDRRLATVATSVAGDLTARYAVGYRDDAGRFANGHRTVEAFARTGPDANAACQDVNTLCEAVYTYDARDRLRVHRHGYDDLRTDYDLDDQGNVTTRKLVQATVVQHQVDYTYAGNQLRTAQVLHPTAEAIQRYFHDERGRQHCVTFDAPDTACQRATGEPAPAGLAASWEFDYLDRVAQYSSWTDTGVPHREAEYLYDALGRVEEQAERHHDPQGGVERERTTEFAYLGLSGLVAGEDHHDAYQTPPEATPARTKTFSYDAFGTRLGMTDQPDGGAEQWFTYGYDVHGSVTQLLDHQGAVTATYGYAAYGSPDEALSAGDDDLADPVNPFRYTGKRLDTASGELDMGARRYAPDPGRLLQHDQLHGALGNLGLGLDPLTGNRYALAGGNPVSYIVYGLSGPFLRFTCPPDPDMLRELARELGVPAYVDAGRSVA